MSKFKGTPGPWIVDGSVIRGDADRFGATVTVASTLDVAWPYGRRAIKEKPYNAHLIAAAPELLEACQALLTYHDYEGYVTAVDMARSAIAKAFGEGEP